MSRKYQIDVTARNVSKMDAVKSWLKKEWDFHETRQWGQKRKDSEALSPCLRFIGIGQVVETEEEFADRIAKATWDANGEYCEVEVQMICLDNLPLEVFHCGKDEYEILMTE